MKICFITVNYNNVKLTEEYVNSILNLKKKENDFIKIIIVDNNSPNKEEQNKLENLRKENINIIYNDLNSGYFPGLNKGIDYIKNQNFDYIVIGNNDIVYNEDFLEKIEKSSYDNETLVICPNIITKDGKYQNPMLKRRLSFSQKIKTRLYFYNYFATKIISKIKKYIKLERKGKALSWEKSDYIWIGIGACYILTNDFRKYIPKLDDRVFLWGEEALFANQIHKINKKVYYDSDIKVIHHESASVSLISSKNKFELVKKSYKIYGKYL